MKKWLKERYPITMYIPRNRNLKTRWAISAPMPIADNERLVPLFNYRKCKVEPYKLVTEGGHIITFELTGTRIGWWLGESPANKGDPTSYLKFGAASGPFVHIAVWYSFAYAALTTGDMTLMPMSEIPIRTVDDLMSTLPLEEKGYVVHHIKQWNGGNNDLANLELIRDRTHSQMHSAKRAKDEAGRLKELRKIPTDKPEIFQIEGECTAKIIEDDESKLNAQVSQLIMESGLTWMPPASDEEIKFVASLLKNNEKKAEDQKTFFDEPRIVLLRVLDVGLLHIFRVWKNRRIWVKEIQTSPKDPNKPVSHDEIDAVIQIERIVPWES